MRTAEKRKYFIKKHPVLFDYIVEDISYKEYRKIDKTMQTVEDVTLLQYTITLLCDELVSLTNENEGE